MLYGAETEGEQFKCKEEPLVDLVHYKITQKHIELEASSDTEDNDRLLNPQMEVLFEVQSGLK